MTRVLSEGKGYQILYKERGEDSEKIAPSGMSCLSRLDVPVPGIIAAADSGKRIRITGKRYFLVCQGRMEAEEGVMEDLLFHDSRSNRTFPVKRMRKGAVQFEKAPSCRRRQIREQDKMSNSSRMRRIDL